MASYKVMASPGNFGKRSKKAHDKSKKIIDAANKKIQSMERASNFEARQQEVYLRAQKYAQGQEEQSREDNFRLETEERQRFADAIQQDYKNSIENARQIEKAANPQVTKLKELLGLVPQLGNAYLENAARQDKEEKQAASVAAYEHGFNFNTLENVLALNDQLTLSQFQATDYIQGLQEQGWSEDRINALYEFQYKTRGSKAWVDNVALAENSVEDFKYGLNNELVKNHNLTPEEQIEATRNYTRDFIGNVSVNGRSISAEVMSTVIAPKVRSAESRALQGLQKARIEDRNIELAEEKNKVFSNTFKMSGPAGLWSLNAVNPSKFRRDEIVDFVMNSHRNGTLNTDQLASIVNSKFAVESTDKVGTIAEHFVGDDKVAELTEYLSRVEKAQAEAYRTAEDDRLEQTNFEVVRRLNDVLRSGGQVTEQFLGELEEFGRTQAGVTFQSDEIDYAREYMTPKAQIRKVTYKEGKKLIAEGSTLQDLREFGLTQSQLNQEVNGEPSLMQQARNNEEAMKNPFYTDSKKSISEHIGGHKNVQNNAYITGDKRGLNHEINYWNKAYHDKFWRTMNINGQDAENAHDIALAATYKGIDDYLDVQSNSQSDQGLVRWKNDMKVAQREEEEVVEFNKQVTELRLSRANKGRLAQEIGKELFMNATEAIESSTKDVPAMFRRAAEIYNMTPFEFQQYIAPAFGKDGVEFDATTAQTMFNTFKPERMPLIRNTYGTSARVQRFKADAGSLTGAVRGGVNIQKFRNAITAKESTNDYNVVNQDSGAIGIGQVMPANVGPWTQKYLGTTLTPEQFRSSPEAQDAVINGRFMDMINQQTQAGYSVDIAIRRAASEWYSGDPNLYNNTREQGAGKYPTIASYTLDILERYYSQ